MHFQYSFYYLLRVSIVILPTVFCQATQNTVLNNDTDAFINQLLAEWKSPGGVGIAVVREDSQGTWNIETKGYGIATGNGSQVTENTLFGIGSNSKLFDICATGLLIHNVTLTPRLSWTSKIASIIPGWDLEDPIAAKQIAIKDAMSHRTGLPRHDFSRKSTDTAQDTIKKLKFQRPSAEFRDVYQYNNNMYIMLSYLPSLLLPSKIPFARYVKQHILDPLGMSSTTYSYDVANGSGQLADGMARQQTNASKDIFGGIPRALPFWSTSGGEDGNVNSGPGGVISNAVDMAVWLQTFLLNGVKPGTNVSVIPADVIQEITTGISVESGAVQFPELSPVVYGAGQSRGTYRGHEFIEHGGDVPGFHSTIARYPFDKLGVAVLTNDDDYGPLIALIIKYYLADQAFGLEKVDWNSRIKALVSIPTPPAAPRPANASFPSGNFASLAGVYNNDGYGKFELCLAFPKDPAPSHSCSALTANISTTLPGAIKPGVPTFVAKWNESPPTHITISHFNGNTFNISTFTSYPTGNATEPFWTSGISDANTGALAEVVVNGHQIGFGATGIWGAGAGVPSPQGNTVRERSEVWFDKI